MNSVLTMTFIFVTLALALSAFICTIILYVMMKRLIREHKANQKKNHSDIQLLAKVSRRMIKLMRTYDEFIMQFQKRRGINAKQQEKLRAEMLDAAEMESDV